MALLSRLAVSPWALVGALVLWIGTGVGAYIKGGRDAVNAEAARAARDQELTDKVYASAQQATAEEIAKIRISNTTIRQELEKEIIRDPVYANPDCVLSDPAFSMLNNQLQGPPGESARSSELPRDAGGAR